MPITARGLEDVVALTSSISTIVESTLIYRGFDVDELVEKATFEEVVYLLLWGRLPSRSELEEFRRELGANRDLPTEVVDMTGRLALIGLPVDAMRGAISALGFVDPDASDNSSEANRRKAIRLVAQAPTIAAALHRLGLCLPVVHPRQDLDQATSFLYQLKGQMPSDVAVEALNKVFLLHADHELNASTFAARVVASTLADIHAAITAAMAALKGPLHGAANQAVIKMLDDIAAPSEADAYVADKLARKEKIMGFGHRVYKHGDPRAKHLRRLSKELGEWAGDTRWYEISVAVEEAVVRRKAILPNVDFYAASVYRSLGIPDALFTPVFAVSRMAGWTAHVLEQYADNRLIRPRAEYTGLLDQRYTPIEARG